MSTLPILALVFAFGVAGWFVWDQQRRGRFDPPPDFVPTSAWFEQLIARIPAEVAGAAWDDTVGAEEVKAILTRWVLEQKLAVAAETRAGSTTLALKLLVPAASLHGYEGALARSLFVKGEMTDFETVRQFYVERDRVDPHAEIDLTGALALLGSAQFHAAAEIRESLLEKAQSLTSRTEEDTAAAPAASMFHSLSGSIKGSKRRDLVWIAFLIPVLMFSASDEAQRETTLAEPRTGGVFTLGLILYFVASGCAERLRRRPRLTLTSLLLLFPVLLIPLLGTAFEAMRLPLSTPAGVWLAFVSLASIVSVFRRARSTESPRQVSERQTLERGREFLSQRLTSSESIPSSWLPYAVAFGLDDLIRIEAGSTPPGFAACGGVAGWLRFVHPLASPIATRKSG